MPTKHTSIPVRIVPNSAAPSNHPVVTLPDVEPKHTPVAAAPQKKVRAPHTTNSVEHRRRLIWPIVGGIMVLVVGAWVSLLHVELKYRSGGNIFSDLKRLLASYPKSPSNETAQEKEIKNLSQQVFPQFQK